MHSSDPMLQFIMFNFLFATFGLVLIIINFILLLILGRLLPGWFESDRVGGSRFGGGVCRSVWCHS